MVSRAPRRGAAFATCRHAHSRARLPHACCLCACQRVYRPTAFLAPHFACTHAYTPALHRCHTCNRARVHIARKHTCHSAWVPRQRIGLFFATNLRLAHFHTLPTPLPPHLTPCTTAATTTCCHLEDGVTSGRDGSGVMCCTPSPLQLCTRGTGCRAWEDLPACFPTYNPPPALLGLWNSFGTCVSRVAWRF